MSNEFYTLRKGVFINSSANDEIFSLRAYKGEREIKRHQYSYQDYCNYLKFSWQHYVGKNARPYLLGFPIKDTDLIEETRHSIAPSSFSVSTSPLPDYRLDFALWLKINRKKINSKLDRVDFNNLNSGLDNILAMHFDRSIKIKLEK